VGEKEGNQQQNLSSSPRSTMLSRDTLRLLAAGAIGNVLEWYDFAIYGYFAFSIGQTFFPRSDPVAQVLSAFGVFAAGYLVRPFGGALTGTIADRFGRQAALSFSVTAMAVPTFLFGTSWVRLEKNPIKPGFIWVQ
jgi:MHS family proline/betaine transporter-like MFS transporter